MTSAGPGESSPRPPLTSSSYFGNAGIDGPLHRGWIVGAFMNDGDLRRTEDVEIKWARHRAGERRVSWQEDEWRTTVVMLVSGRFRLDLPTGSYTLVKQGDYAMWGPGMGHSWQAEEDCVVVTVRWPSAGRVTSS